MICKAHYAAARVLYDHCLLQKSLGFVGLPRDTCMKSRNRNTDVTLTTRFMLRPLLLRTATQEQGCHRDNTRQHTTIARFLFLTSWADQSTTMRMPCKSSTIFVYLSCGSNGSISKRLPYKSKRGLESVVAAHARRFLLQPPK